MKSKVHSFAVQCSLLRDDITVKEIGIQCSLPTSLRCSASSGYLQTSSPFPSDSSQSESEMFESEQQETADHDSSVYILQEDSAS